MLNVKDNGGKFSIGTQETYETGNCDNVYTGLVTISEEESTYIETIQDGTKIWIFQNGQYPKLYW